MKKVIPADSILIPDSAQLVFEGDIFSVYQWDQTLYDGSSKIFEMLKRFDTTNAICVVDNKIIVLDDEQPNRASLKTFPGGRVDPEDADILAATKREVLEEAGYSFDNWRLVQVIQPVRKIEWFSYLFLAWGVSGQQETHHDPGEKITYEILAFEDLKDLVMARSGHLGEAFGLFENLHAVDDLMALPEFQGKEVDR